MIKHVNEMLINNNSFLAAVALVVARFMRYSISFSLSLWRWKYWSRSRPSRTAGWSHSAWSEGTDPRPSLAPDGKALHEHG